MTKHNGDNDPRTTKDLKAWLQRNAPLIRLLIQVGMDLWQVFGNH